MNLRKIIFVAVALIACMVFSANARSRSLGVHPNGIGLRFGGGSLWGAEINYQLGMGRANRFEVGFGWNSWSGYTWHEWREPSYGNHRREWLYTNNSSFGAFGAYQWHWNISPSAARGGFNWYAGPGAGVGFWSYKIDMYRPDYVGLNPNNSGIKVDVGGQIGIEYDFNAVGAPILLDIDSRPTLNIPSGNFGFDLALGVRYTF